MTTVSTKAFVILKLQCLVYLKRMPSKDWVMREAENFPFSDKQVEVGAQHLPGSTEHHKGLESDKETEGLCEGCWSGRISSATRGAKPEEETALGVLECENPNPLCAWLRGPAPSWEPKWRDRFVVVPMGGLCNTTQIPTAVPGSSWVTAETHYESTSPRADQWLQQVLE